jgi:beta-lactamase class A
MRLYKHLKSLPKLPPKPTLEWVALFLFVVVAVQVFYPEDRALPFAQIDHWKVGTKTFEELSNELTRVSTNLNVPVKVAGKTDFVPLAETGVDIDVHRTVVESLRYPWWQRVIPFSSVYRMQQHKDVVLRIDNERMAEFVKATSTACRTEPRSGNITLEGETVKLVPAVWGTECPEEEIIRALTTMKPLSGTFAIPQKSIAPKYSDVALMPLLTQAQSAVNVPLKIRLGTEVVTVPKTTLASWVDLTPVDGEQRLIFRADAIEVYLQSIEQKNYIAPSATQVTTEDGVEISRIPGKPGRGIDLEKTSAAVVESLTTNNTKIIHAATKTLPSTAVQINRTYGKASHGLELLLRDIAAEKGNYGIAVREITGAGRVASANGDKRYITASTYKLFVAYSVLKSVENGSLHWGDGFLDGRTVQQCFNDMIIKSDNPCAKAFSNRFGWANITTQMRGFGLGSTYVGSPNNLSTANDEALFLEKIERGEIVGGNNRDRLLEAMRTQVYRKGIPTGTKVTVADKVGFLDGLLHDAAIVYGPKSTYVVVILTDGSSWGNIADAAARIHAYLQN